MTIGIDASRANKSQKTGTEWYSYFLIEELKKIACPHRFILYSKDPLGPPLPDNFENRVLFWPPKLFWTQIRLAYEMLARPPDVLFVPAHTLPIFTRAKMVITIHDLGFRAFPHLYSWIDVVYHRFSVWFASRFAYNIICPSEFTKGELIKYYRTNPNKISVIPHGVCRLHSPVFDTKAESREEREKGRVGDNGTGYLLFVGRLEEKKNIRGIVKAFYLILKTKPNLKLVFAGQPGYGFEKVKRLIMQLNLEQKISFKNYVSEQEKLKLYQGAALFLFPTFYEGFGLPILEAQSYGRPVVTSNYGAAKEVARDSAVLVDPQEPEEIAAAAIKILNITSFRSELVGKGLANAQKYRWDQAARRTLEVLEKF